MFPLHEEERLAALRSLQVMDTPPEAEFDAIVQAARHIFDSRMAYVSLVDADRQWFKARCGLDVPETAREVSICQHAIMADAMLVIPDTHADPRVAWSPVVTGEPFVRSYAGVPLRHSQAQGGARYPIGTLCIADDRLLDLTPDKLELLEGLAGVIEGLLDARRARTESLKLALSRQEALIESERAQRILQQAERMARIGSWQLDLATNDTHWSAQTYAIHQLAVGDKPDLEQALLHYPPTDREMLRTALDACAATGQSWDLEADLVNAQGIMRRVRLMGEAEVRADKIVAVIGVIQDITERYKIERRLREFALTDELTGLASRRAFNETLDEALASASAEDTALAIAIIDLDRFKEVNDRLGHPAGDEVLRAMAAKLGAADHLGDYLAARLGGDEFVVMLRGSHATERLADGITQLLTDLRHTVYGEGADPHVGITVSATIGACTRTARHADRPALMKAADEALYTAKRANRGTGAIAGNDAVLVPHKAATASAHA
ncbi:sensor domain-containing diguanylate cyclase [Sphingomonas dokdonensis]|uniref:Cyclic di-GMP phosphodiesterase Gmr n=1 Tax=Sphingomonas dokdonensis TaxID=344880 RepID=A0A245ZG96_9SPHN|nr:sensor domain-containing diguanylate cyclase [Sphingomonas dokdonensis]OWK28771.1 cyclic di-GMP phosphodiesterase Gmr [Sphingomonas dokdonensis]